MDMLIILQAGVATGTALLFATLGELLAERSGVMNLGVEGMMLLGAMAGYWVSAHYGVPWLGVIVGMLAAGLISQVHAFITINLRADQVVSGLSLNFLAAGVSVVLGEGLNSIKGVPILPIFDNSVVIANSLDRKNIFHKPGHTGLYWLFRISVGLVLHQSDKTRTAFTGGWGISGCG